MNAIVIDVRVCLRSGLNSYHGAAILIYYHIQVNETKPRLRGKINVWHRVAVIQFSFVFTKRCHV